MPPTPLDPLLAPIRHSLFTRAGAARVSRWAMSLCLLASAAAAGEPLQPKSIEELKGFYQQQCVRCHGMDGSGHDPHGKGLGGLNFIKVTRGFRKEGGQVSEREIRKMTRTIMKGIFFGISMPAWKKQLSQEDADLMVREILLQAEAGTLIEPENAAIVESRAELANPDMKAKSLNELKVIFQQQCTRCHGVDGSARDARGRQLPGSDFTRIAEGYRTQTMLMTDREVRTMIRILQKGLFPGSIMPSLEGKLTQEDANLMIREIVLKAEKGKVIAPGVPPAELPVASTKSL